MNAPPSLHPTDQTLQSYGLGKLDDSTSASVEKHLEDCAACRSRAGEISGDSFLGRVRDARFPQASPTTGWSSAADRRSDAATAPPGTLPPDLAEHPDYTIGRELGRGGMGVVYLVHNQLMGRDEVLKVVSRHLLDRRGVLDRFLREIRSAARLQHPNIVTAYSAFRSGESIVFAMEYVEGLDLAKFVKAKGPLPVAHACYYVNQAALGLQHAHEQGMVHRDIKPGNLMLSRKGDRAIVKVLDFGLAKATREDPLDGGLTHEGQMLGTPDFIAPEQTLDAQKADIRADIYSLGCTLYYLLTGGPPFKGTSLYDILQAHHSMDANPLNLVRPEVPAELAALVAKMMAKEPDRRFQTPAEVAKALTPFFRGAKAAPGVSRIEPALSISPEAPAKTQPAPNQPQPPAANAGAARPDVMWESLIDFKEAEHSHSQDAALAIAEPTRPRPPWIWQSVAAGVLLCGLVAAWGAGVFKFKTANGTIVLKNLPKDAEVFVDGSKITLSWPGIGKSVEIRAVPGQRKVEVKKDGFATFAKELTFKSDGWEEITVRLDPLVDRSGKKEWGAPEATSDGDRVPWVAPGADQNRFVPMFNGKDLTHWKDGRSGVGEWKVVDGVLEGRGSGGRGGGAVLVTERQDFTDFRLRIKYRYPKEGSGSVQIRHSVSEKRESCYAVASSIWPERDARSSPPGRIQKLTNYLYGNNTGNQEKPQVAKEFPAKVNTWHDLEIEAVGNKVSTWFNGNKVAEYADAKNTFRSGAIALACRNDSTVQFQEVRIEELPVAGTSGSRTRGISGPDQALAGKTLGPLSGSGHDPQDKGFQPRTVESPARSPAVRPAGLDVRQIMGRPGVVWVEDENADPPPGPFWPFLAPKETDGWQIGDADLLKMSKRNIELVAGPDGNFLITKRQDFKKCSIIISLAATEGTEVFLSLRAGQSPEGWRAVTSRIIVEGGKVHAGMSSINFQIPERDMIRTELTPKKTFLINFSIDANNTGRISINGKETSSFTLDKAQQVDAVVGSVGLFIKSGTVAIESLKTAD
jgi:serine/threonine protein kinase